MNEIETLYELTDPRRAATNLGSEMLQCLAGGPVVWSSASGSLMVLAIDDGGDLISVRHNRRDPMQHDGLPIVMVGLQATSCGLWTTDGYRTAPPVLVEAASSAALTGHLEDHRARWQALLTAAHEADPAWHQRVPDGHGPRRCPVKHCYVGAAVTDDRRIRADQTSGTGR